MMQITAQPFTSEARKPKWTLTREAIILRMPVAKVSEPAMDEGCGHDGHTLPVKPRVKKRVKPIKIASEPIAHVLAYRAQRDGTTPYKFVRLQAEAEGISYQTLISKRFLDLAPLRQAVVRKTAERFPHLTSPQLGRLFGRDHTAILYTLGRTARAKRRLEAIQGVEEVRV